MPTPTPSDRTPQTVPAPRPTERMFTTRELLLTTWDQRFAMSPADEVKFSYDRWMLEMKLRNAGRSVQAAEVAEFQAVKAGKPDPEKDDPTAPAPAAKPYRKPAPAPL